jgi:hypothetical protein
MERQWPSVTLYRLTLGFETAGLAVAAFASSYAFGDALGVLVEYDLTKWIIAALLAWFAVAWAARRILVGQTKGLSLTGRPVIAWVLLRVALLFSSGFLLVGWLVSLAIGSTLATVFIQAAATLMVASFVVGVAGGATINSLLAANRGWRHTAL